MRGVYMSQNEIIGSKDDVQFLTYSVNIGDNEERTELRYEDDNLWLTTRKMASLYGVNIATINYYIEEVAADSQHASSPLARKYPALQSAAGAEKESEEDYYSLAVILAVGSKVNNERAKLFAKWAGDIAGDYKIAGFKDGNRKKQVKKLLKCIIISLVVIALLIASGLYWYMIHHGNQEMKPVIYLYPKEEMMVDVTLDYHGELTCTYPAYEDGWTVTARPDGMLTDASGQTYNYLYWEGSRDADYDFSQGYCVPGSETALFLEDALEKLGLTRREANEFIVYWLPLMQDNPYNVIAFQTDAYTQAAQLHIDPAPDTLIRVFMAWKPAESFVDIPPQTLECGARNGFTVVEWGGAYVGKTK